MLGQLHQDLRYALRTFARRPGFTLVAVLTLALGIGANTAVFSVVNAVLLRPLPFPQSERLVAVWPQRYLSFAELSALKQRSDVLAGTAGIVGSWNATLTGEGEPAQLQGARPTAGFFATLGVRAALGRVFRAGDGVVGAEPVAVLSHAVWRGRFGSDSSVVGRRITLDGVAHTVIGVLPAGLEVLRADTEVWLPLVQDTEEWYHRGGALFTVGRLAEGRTVEEADRELRALAAGLREEFGLPDDYGGDASVVGLRSRLVGDVRGTLLLLLGAVGFVLLIAGTNIANLLLARGAGRERELAVRSALGAGRARLVAQLLMESVVLAVAGGLAGLATAAAGLGLIVRVLPADTPRLAGVGLDANVLAVCAALAVGAGLLFGTAPAVLAARGAIAGSLSGGRGTAGSGGLAGTRLRSGLVVAEVALALVLLAGAGLMIRTLWNLNRVDPGFEAPGVLTLDVQPTGESLRSPERRQAFYDEVFARIEALPGVASVGAIQHLPLGGGSWGTQIEIEGRPLEPGATPASVGWRIVAAGYFESMRVPLRTGRLFEPRDGPGATPVVVVNETMAREIWPGEDPVGRRVRAPRATSGEWATVIGVVGDVRHSSLDRGAVPELYRSLRQHVHGGMTLTVRTNGDPAAVAPAVRRAIWSVDSDVPISSLMTLEQVVAASLSRERLILTLLGGFALVGTLLGAVGVYSVVAYNARCRRKEIGIRIALGATPGAVLGAVVGSGVRDAGAGVVLGLLGAVVLARLMRDFVFAVGVHDPFTLSLTAALLLIVAAVASFVPASRAAAVDPAETLRDE